MRMKIFLLVIFALVFLVSIGNVSAASIFPYIKTAGPSSDLSSADIQWAAKHWDLSGIELKTYNPNVLAYKYVGLTFFDTVSRNKYWPDWLKYANANNIDPDIGLIHYKKNVNISIGSSTVRPREDRFSKIYTPSGQISRDAYGDDDAISENISLPATTGQAVYFAMENRFKEINFNLGSGASGGWQAKWQYWNGTSWIDLVPSSDTTNMLQQSGKVEFMPPPTTANWKKTSEQNLGLGTDDLPLYWIRILVTSSGTAPVVRATAYYPPTQVGQRGIWAQDYITGADTGSGFMTWPGWETCNDANGDDVRDTNCNPNATATFQYQSRAPLGWYPPGWITNPGDSTFRNWITQWNKVNLADLPGVDGLFFDVQNAYIPDMYGPLHKDDPVYIEYPKAREGGQWESDLASLSQLQTSILEPGDFTYGNIFPYWRESLMNASGGAFLEFYIYAEANSGNGATDWLNTRGNGYSSYWNAQGKLLRFMWSPYYTYYPDRVSENRDKIYGLANYLQMAESNTYYDPGDPMGDADKYWFKAIEWVGGKDADTGQLYTGVGRALGNTYQWVNGTDPASGRTYYVFAREFTNALVLLKPRPRYDSNYTNLTATTHQLGGSYMPLNINGTLGASITQITLRNAEGAILIKESALNLTTCSSQGGNICTAIQQCSGNWTAANDTNYCCLGTCVDDTTPPVITNVRNGTVTNSSATILWTTNESSTSVVYYGTTASLGLMKSDASLVAFHNIQLTSLSLSTLYYYKTGSCDASGNCANSTLQNFTTTVITQTCSDGTAYGQCSSTKSLYCQNGTLVNACTTCGCLSGQQCNATSQACYTPACIPATEICGNGIDEDCNGADLTCPIANYSKLTIRGRVRKNTVPPQACYPDCKITITFIDSQNAANTASAFNYTASDGNFTLTLIPPNKFSSGYHTLKILIEKNMTKTSVQRRVYVR